MSKQTVDFKEFTVFKSNAAKFLGTSTHNLEKLNLPFVRVGACGREKFRQSDLDRVQAESLHNAEALIA